MAGEKRLLRLQPKCCAMMAGLLEPCIRGHNNIILNKGNGFKRNHRKNNRFPFLDILGYLKNTHKNPKFGRVRQVSVIFSCEPGTKVHELNGVGGGGVKCKMFFNYRVDELSFKNTVSSLL